MKSGRTHLMDATPVNLGQEFGGYARQVRSGSSGCRRRSPRRRGSRSAAPRSAWHHTPKGFPQRVIAQLASDTGLPITEALDHFEAQGARDALVEASGALKVIAVSLTKINNDLRWMGSVRTPAWASCTSPTCSRVVDHARQGQPGHPRATLMVAPRA